MKETNNSHFWHGFEDFKYWALVLVLNYLPAIGVQYLLRACMNNASLSSLLLVSGFLYTVMILPVYLISINYFLSKNFGINYRHFLVNGIIILSCIALSTYFHYEILNEITGRNIYRSDEGPGVVDLERTLGIMASLLGFMLVYFRMRYKSRKEKEAEEKRHS